jgi:hypothetical protein
MFVALINSAMCSYMQPIKNDYVIHQANLL